MPSRSVYFNLCRKMPTKRKVEKSAKADLDQSDSSMPDSTLVISTKEFFATEDSLADQTSAQQDAALFHKTTERLSGLLAKYHDGARKATSDTTQLDSVQVDIMVAITFLRRLNRMAHFRNKKLRDQVSEERQKAEEQYLQLQNLLYEVTHIEKEVEKCLEFKSDHEDIEMIPVEQFYNEAPDSIAKPAATKQDAHAQRLARLNWELETRKKLEAELETVEKEKADFLKQIEKCEGQLGTMQPKLEALLEASRPLQETLDMPYEKEAAQRQYANYLPSCLYYLYIQALAFKEVFEKRFYVNIDGDLDRVKKMIADKRNSGLNNEEEEETDGSDSDNESQQHEVQHHAQKKEGRQRRATVTEILDEQQRMPGVLDPFPLYVEFKANCKGKATVCLRFFYVEYLGVIGVKSKLELMADVPRAVASANDLLSDNSILMGLFPGDLGLVCPNPTGVMKLDHMKVDLKSMVDASGRPFDWVQRLAGLNFPSATSEPQQSADSANTLFKVAPSDDDKEGASASNEMPRDAEDGCQFFQSMLQRVQKRVMARLALQEQFAAFESLNVHPPKEVSLWFPSRIYSRLTQWSSSTYDDFICHPASNGFRQVVNEDGWFCSVTVERGTAKLTALVYIHIDYPHTAPLFCILLKWKDKVFTMDKCSDLWHLSKAVNVECVASLPKRLANSMLGVQLQFLISRLDVLLEIRSSEGGTKEFPTEHLFQALRKGRDRRLPFWYNEDRNCYTFEKP